MAIPRIHKETTVFDPDNTIEGGIDGASGTATSYITEVSEHGIWVTPRSNKPTNGSATQATSGWHIADALELFKLGVRYIKAWLNGPVPTLRLGQDSSGHTDVTPYGMDIYADATKKLAKFGRTGSLEVVENYGSFSVGAEMARTHAWTRMTAPDITNVKAYLLVGSSYEELPYGANTGADVYYTKSVDSSEVSISVVNMSSSAVTVFVGEVRNSVDSGTTEIVMGDENEGYAVIDYRSMMLVDRDGKPYFDVRDMRDADGKARIVDTFDKGSARSFILSFAVDSVVSVTVDGTAVSASNYSVSSYVYTFDGFSYSTSRLQLAQGVSGSTVVCTYETASDTAKTLTFGTRGSGNVGGNSVSFGMRSSSRSLASFAEGIATVASGWGAHAEGVTTVASGLGSHASGFGTVAASESQVAIGAYNVKDSGNAYALIIGNGVADDDRTNALTLSWSGNLWIEGSLTQNSDRRLKEHRSHLDDIGPELVRSLKPALYEKDGSPHYGFYAQDVAEADEFDALVGEEANGYLTLDYQGIIAPLVAYCQHLEKRIEALEGGE